MVREQAAALRGLQHVVAEVIQRRILRGSARSSSAQRAPRAAAAMAAAAAGAAAGGEEAAAREAAFFGALAARDAAQAAEMAAKWPELLRAAKDVRSLLPPSLPPSLFAHFMQPI